MDERTLLARRLRRAEAARENAERLLEDKSRALYLANKRLEEDRCLLEARVAERTAALDRINGALRTENAERKRTERALIAAKARAEGADAAKGEFLAVMSHEIRTPLNALIGMVELASTCAASREQADYLRRALRNADVLRELINDILDMSKIEAGRVGLQAEPADLADIVEDVVESLRHGSASSSTEVHCVVPTDVRCRTLLDPARLRQILVNLVGNALKFTPVGHVRIELRYGKPDGDYLPVEIAVSDTGIGIAAEDQARIFERFDRGRRGRIQSGTGLGLAIARSLAELMGGRLGLESEVGHGSTFTLRLRPKIVSIGPRHVSAPGPIWVIDASAQGRANLAKMLTGLGIETVVSETCTPAPPCDPRTVLFVRRAGAALPRPPKHARLLVAGNAPGPLPSNAVALGLPLTIGAVERALQALEHGPQGGGEVVSRGPEMAPQPPPCVLLAEDNQDSRGFLRLALERSGYRVDLAPDGVVALEKAAAFRYDLIVTDLQMPRMDGIDATIRIRTYEQERGREPTPSIAVSAHTLGGYRERALQAGVSAFMAKPVKTAELLAEVAARIDKRPVLLVVEDHGDTRLLVEHMLAEAPVRVVSVESGREALEVLRRRRISVMMTDRALPDMDGLHLAEQALLFPHTRGLPIIAATGEVGPDARAASLASGCAEHLDKPIDRTRLLAALSRYFDLGTRNGVKQNSPTSRPEPSDAVHEALPAQQKHVFDVDAAILDLIPQFMANRDKDVARIRRLLKGEGWTELGRIGHDLKGCGVSFGFPGISKTGAKLERAASAHDAESVSVCVERLCDEMKAARRYLLETHPQLRLA